MEKEKQELIELIKNLDPNDEYILFFYGMVERHLESYEKE